MPETPSARKPRPAAPERAAAPSTALEVELRLTLATADIPRVETLPAVAALAAGPARRVHLQTTYYDTPDLALAARGVALRVRRGDGGCMQGIKTFGEAGGEGAIPVRREWEWAVRDGLDLAVMGDPELAHLVPSDLAPRLRPVIVTDVRRTILALAVAPQGAIELALDQGQITATPSSGAPLHRPIAEIELELKAGRVADLFRIAGEIHRRVPLRLTARSKAHEGFALLTGRAPAAVPARPIALSPATTVAEAFRHIGRNALAQLLENEPALTAGADGDALREMAAATRRLDAAFGLFKDLLACPRGDGLRHELKRLRTVLAEARLRERIALLLTQASQRGKALPPSLATTLAGRRRAARLAVTDLLRSPRWTAWVLGFAEWLEDGDWARAPRMDATMTELAPSLLAVRFRKVERKAGAGPDDGEPPPKLRRRVDKLRYTLDFMRSLLPAGRVKPALGALTDYRVALRDRAELATALALVREAAGSAPKDERAALKALERRLAKAAEAAGKEQPARWKALKDAWAWEA